MENYTCEFCGKNFANKYVLKNHKVRTKSCIEIQKKINIDKENDLQECKYCSNLFSPHLMKRHLQSCKSFKENALNVMIEKNTKLELEIKEKDFIISELKKQLKEKDEFYKKEHECILEMAKQPKTKVTNNTTNKILSLNPLNLSVERIKDVIQTQFDHNYGAGGQKGIAEFAKEKLLTDDDGNLNYVCTDFDRKVFKYKDDTGEVRKDTKAKKLTNKLVKAGLIERNQNASEQWWVDEKGEIIKDRHNFMAVQMAEINKIENDNSVFIKELSAITVP